MTSLAAARLVLLRRTWIWPDAGTSLGWRLWSTGPALCRCFSFRATGSSLGLMATTGSRSEGWQATRASAAATASFATRGPFGAAALAATSAACALSATWRRHRRGPIADVESLVENESIGALEGKVLISADSGVDASMKGAAVIGVGKVAVAVARER